MNALLSHTPIIWSACTGAFIGLALGIVGCWIAIRRDRSSMGFAALGAVVGLFMGLSATPILSTTITGVFTLLGILIPIYFPPQHPVDPDDRLAPPAVTDWLLPFASSMAGAALLGIAFRVNDALNFTSPSLRDHYHALGFNENQVTAILESQSRAAAGERPNLLAQYKTLGFTDDQAKAIMQRHAESIQLDPAGQTPADFATILKSPGSGSGLQADYDPIDYQQLWTDLVRADDSPANNLARLQGGAGNKVRDRIRQLQSQQLSAQVILDTLKGELRIP